MNSLIHFFKYHGAGNDFILIDCLEDKILLSSENVNFLCHRRFGIGADGVITIHKSKEFDFEMKYYNSDGFEGTMCGNGGRCIVAFAGNLGLIKTYTKFKAIDGIHEANILYNNRIKLKMNDIQEYIQKDKYYFLDSGSPHYVEFVNDIDKIDVYSRGKEIRYSSEFQPKGTNVNFIEESDNYLKIRTYERGVEDETYACGTGSVASSIAYAIKNNLNSGEIYLEAKGGNLKVYFQRSGNLFTDIWLEGGAEFVFEGSIEI
jgi:diaminopimelate epimerase